MTYTTTIAGPPRHVSIALTDKCNLRCATCPHSFEPEDAFRELDAPVDRILEFITGASMVSLHGLGEVFLYKRLWDILPNPLLDANDVGWTTAGHLLTDDAIAKVLERNVSWLNFSMHGGTPNTYMKVHGASFRHLWNRVDALIKARGDNRNPRLVANMMLMRCNIAELPVITRMVAERQFVDLRIYHMNRNDHWKGSGLWADGSSGFDYAAEADVDPREEANAVTEAAKIARDFGMPLLGIGRFLGSRWEHDDLRATVV